MLVNMKKSFSNDSLKLNTVCGFSYPTLAKVAKKYLCIFASSYGSEGLFTFGHVASSKKGNLLKSYRLNMLVFLARNLQ